MFLFLLGGGSSGGGLGAGEDVLTTVLDDGDDEALGKEVLEAGAGKGTVDLEAVADNGAGDELVLGDIVDELVKGLLVENDLVLEFVLDASLGGPLLLLLSALVKLEFVKITRNAKRTIFGGELGH